MADKLTIFGNSHNQIGSSDADLILKTRGKIKIQWGKKFIDLLKDGKINVDADFIFKDNKVGSKDGIYVLDDGTVWLRVSGAEAIPLVSDEVGTTYVSFLQEQKTEPSYKHQALVNIGFLYADLTSVNETSLQNGIIYVESEQKLYMVQDGTLSEFKVSIPNPFTTQFVIAKNDSSRGALLIRGQGVENSLAFDQAWIYTDGSNLTLETELPMIFRVGSREPLELTDQTATFTSLVRGDTFQSRSASSTSGFRLYMVNGESILEVDRLLVRKGDDGNSTPLYPEYWLWCNNIVVGYSLPEVSSPSTSDDEGSVSVDEDVEDDATYQEFTLTLSQISEFQEGDELIMYKKDISISSSEGDTAEGEEEDRSIEQINYTPVRMQVTSQVDEYSIFVKVEEGLTTSSISSFVGQFIFLIKREGNYPLRLKDNTLDVVEYAEGVEEVRARFGSVKPLELAVISGNTTEKAEEIVQNADLFSKMAVFGLAKYLSDATIPEDDDSSTLATTAWVRTALQQLKEEILATIVPPTS